MKQCALLIGFGLLLILVIFDNAANFYHIRFLQKLDNILYDYRLRQTMTHEANRRMVILDIGGKSLKEEGRWPWTVTAWPCW